MLQSISYIFLACLLMLGTMGFQTSKPMANPALRIQVTGLKNASAKVMVGVYRASDEFPKQKKEWKGVIHKPTSASSTSLEMGDIPFGEYAIAIYQDLNGNGKLDTNIFGAPTEPYGFSNNVRPKFSAPSFDDCSFTYNENANLLIIKIK